MQTETGRSETRSTWIGTYPCLAYTRIVSAISSSPLSTTRSSWTATYLPRWVLSSSGSSRRKARYSRSHLLRGGTSITGAGRVSGLLMAPSSLRTFYRARIALSQGGPSASLRPRDAALAPRLGEGRERLLDVRPRPLRLGAAAQVERRDAPRLQQARGRERHRLVIAGQRRDQLRPLAAGVAPQPLGVAAGAGPLAVAVAVQPHRTRRADHPR